MSARLSIRSGPAPIRELTLAEKIDALIDRAYALRSAAGNDCRRPDQSEALLDGLYDVGKTFMVLGRGRHHG